MSLVAVAPPGPVQEPQNQLARAARPSRGADQGQPVPYKGELLDFVGETNLCDFLDDAELIKIGVEVVEGYDMDQVSRSDWLTKTKKATELAMQVAMKKTYPWPGASNVIYPLMTTASIQFAARAYPAIINGKNVVKGSTVGPDKGTPQIDPQTGQPAVDPQTGQPLWIDPPGSNTIRANLMGEHMSYQLLDQQPEWEPETDKLLHVLPIVGCVFRKTYNDPSKQRNVSTLVLATKVAIKYNAKSLETAPRVTEEIEFYPNEVREFELAGTWRTIEYGTEALSEADPSASMDKDALREFLEQHRYDDLDGDGYKEPYIVTVHKQTQKVVRIVARYDQEGIKTNSAGDIIKIEPVHYYTKYDFLPNPDGIGVYGVGFGQLLRPINEAVNTTLNMLIDAGHLQNTGGGFIGKQLSMHTGDVRFKPGEYKSINAAGATIKDNIVPLNFPGPSAVLFQLLGMLIEAGKEVASVKDVLTGEQKDANIPATTTLALIEQGLKVFSSIYKRIYRALKVELNKLRELNRKYLPDQADFQVGNVWKSITREIYDKVGGVEPVADPTMVTDMQRLGRGQFLLQFRNDPSIDGDVILKRVFAGANIERIDELFKPIPAVPPDVAVKGMELELKAERIRSEGVKDLAQSIYFLAMAAKAASQSDLAWYESQMDVLMRKLEASSGGESGAGDEGSPSPGATGGGGAKLPTMASPSGHESLPPVPTGLPGAPPGPPSGLAGGGGAG